MWKVHSYSNSKRPSDLAHKTSVSMYKNSDCNIALSPFSLNIYP